VFRAWAAVLKEAGIRRVTGDVVADDRMFDRVWHHPRWSPEQAWKWYFAPACALSVNDNCVTVSVKPGQAAGDAALVSLQPPTGTLEIANTCATAAKRHVIWFERRAGQRDARVGGHVRLGSGGYAGRMTVPDPPLYAVETLRSVLADEGISVAGSARVVAQDERAEGRRLHLRKTPLMPVLRTMVKRSHNHYAEQVLKTIGAESYGLGSWGTGAQRASRLVRGLGFREDEFRVDDGSGLSRGNRLPPAALTALLVEMRRSEHYAQFNSCLAVAGRDGTLDDRLTAAPYAGNVRGKTGYLSGVGALSGYATTRGGIEVAFSILVNDDENPPGTYSMRQTVDAICRAIVDHAN
jgi:D-alanyl-D-alanine carboxypeptidase/D-alanyl-D-alanine-endopeptidase (penicillin-binding protein 4)